MKETEQMLKRKAFVTTTKDGTIEALYCKVCGSKIAGVTMRPSGPGNAPLVPKFSRFPNYVEAKFSFNDNSFHVTNGCDKCLSKALTVKQMAALYKCDCAEMQMEPGKRKPVAVTVVDTTQSGIL